MERATATTAIARDKSVFYWNIASIQCKFVSVIFARTKVDFYSVNKIATLPESELSGRELITAG